MSQLAIQLEISFETRGFFMMKLTSILSLLFFSFFSANAYENEKSERGANNVFFCKDTYKIVNAHTKEEQSLYPTKCEETMKTFKEGFFCKDTYKIVNAHTKEEQNLYPTKCKELERS